MIEQSKIPALVRETAHTLEEGGFEAYIVGGCVRDLVMGREPHDWDITTDARPEEIVTLFEKTFYENAYGTVTVVHEDAPPELRHIEVTPFRKEGAYRDMRHPDTVTFGVALEEDLERRDFTINAIAYRTEKNVFVDPFGGIKDIKDKRIAAVGDPEHRFSEDALRMIRGVRFVASLDFTIDETTARAIKKMAKNISILSIERIRDEFEKIILSKNPEKGLKLAFEFGLLHYIVPELEETVGVEQNGDHPYPVWEHILKALQHSADRDFPLEIRLAALFHDIGKPRTREFSREKEDYTFYGHDTTGARMTKRILERLKFPVKTIETAVKLVRHHMFFTDIEKITLSAVRRMIRNVGEERIWDLMKVRTCDRIGMNRPVEEPYRLRKYESMIEEALRDPTSVKMLNIDGARVMEVTRETPGPKIGYILHALLEEVLDDPSLNSKEYLENRAGELVKLEDKELKKLGESGKLKKGEMEEGELKKIRSKYRVK
ncbi:MAG TPA: hypothetical protein DCZ84_01240 [Candidatus Vogelbacteria bacterium]|uniref:HD domain-containing protein n=1 Tax=Candidatus Vogelbacteria bacterium RIFOXYD1_FULL_51_18 TaxID=1802440 RepID=A0A1G2QGW1_9BACT|nr:MAG: PolyA polymerase [Parcubacteria group bacterium GW2011_GWC1_51_35]KKW25238.1 MAG: PolyA polymerase [Parcubacteria group bacterium GW2011_GWF2_52_12]KKW26158.1 MAG: PolyA polymerase [Parcubacteria group bacterium GW2011_GWF1_52_5]KKW38672.1 MAG: PolyA polymerase [Parcubacteria group bacterium GW2011_GWA1_54_88]OHA59874.1 MAG: hypothetical protein A2569_01115 [Candidatus Vogelbacteria bacterium RIFOXYD1_FULL_51_18]HBB65245.1 hypothetical protein [Candidatus Vogelbacteria bacterium]